MAATQHATTECAHCSESYSFGYDGQYCSEKCLWRERGESIQRQIDSDHKWCSTCYAKRKRVSVPPEDFIRDKKVRNGVHSAESIIGFEYLEPQMRREHGFTFCQCGNIDHYAEIDELRGVDLQDVLVNLWSLLVEYYEQDQFGDNRPDKEVLFDTLKESDLDWRLALGRSVYSE